MEILPVVGIILLLLAVLILQIVLLRKQKTAPLDLAPVFARTEAIERAQERTERGLREEVGRNREEAAHDSSDLRQEIQAALATFNSGIRDEIIAMSTAQKTQLEVFGAQLGSIRDTLDQRLAAAASPRPSPPSWRASRRPQTRSSKPFGARFRSGSRPCRMRIP